MDTCGNVLEQQVNNKLI